MSNNIKEQERSFFNYSLSSLFVFMFLTFFISLSTFNTMSNISYQNAAFAFPPTPTSPPPHKDIPPSCNDNFSTYQNSTYGISIQYPSCSIVDENIGDPNNRKVDSKGQYLDIVKFRFPKVTKYDTYDSNVFVGIASWEPISLTDYFNLHVKYYQASRDDFTIIRNDTDATLAGNPAYKLNYDDVKNNVNIRWLDIGTVIGDKIYYIEYSAEKGRYNDYIQIVEKMIDSFKFTTTPIPK